jgi:hypothetical protein
METVDITKPRALPVAIKEACGLPGEPFDKFKAEYEKLTESDREWFRRELLAAGWAIK